MAYHGFILLLDPIEYAYFFHVYELLKVVV